MSTRSSKPRLTNAHARSRRHHPYKHAQFEALLANAHALQKDTNLTNMPLELSAFLRMLYTEDTIL